MADTVMRAIDRDVTPALLALAVIAPDDTRGAGTACRDSLRDLKTALEAGASPDEEPYRLAMRTCQDQRPVFIDLARRDVVGALATP